MAIWITEKHTDHSIGSPGIFYHVRPHCQCNDARKDSNVLNHRRQSSFLTIITEAGKEDERNDMEDVGH
jgi:hypothetical protein